MLAIQRSDLDETWPNRSCDMYLGPVQAPGLGKFCGQRTRPIKVFEKCQNFRKFRKFRAKLMFTAQNRASGMSEVFDFVEHVLKGI